MEMENRENSEQELPATEKIPEVPEETVPEVPQSEPYVPRPVWQRVLAWIALVIFLGIVASYYINIMRGGL